MNPTQQRRIIKAIAALAIVFALLLLLLPHAASHSAPLFWLALAPALLFAILEVPSAQRLPIQAIRPAAPRQSYRPARFQRPPPSA